MAEHAGGAIGSAAAVALRSGAALLIPVGGRSRGCTSPTDPVADWSRPGFLSLFPDRKGLSSFYSGKSKSFTSLAEATSTVAAAKELAKPENPFNKRRRILANWSRRASCSSLATATYLPPLLGPDHAVAEGDEGEEDDSDDDVEYSQLPHRGKNVRDVPALPLPPTRLGGVGMQRRNGLGSFRSPRSFSLSDLHNSSSTDGSD